MEMKITRVQQELASDKKPIYGDVAKDSHLSIDANKFE